MEIILLKDLDKVGDKYDVVKVKNGYGRNFLIPKGIGILANESNMKKLEEIKSKELAELNEKINELKEIATTVEGKTLKIGAKSGTSGKIFGSITSVQIVNALSEQLNIAVERRKVKLPDDIKTLGTYTAILDLHPEVQGSVDFEVVSE